MKLNYKINRESIEKAKRVFKALEKLTPEQKEKLMELMTKEILSFPDDRESKDIENDT